MNTSYRYRGIVLAGSLALLASTAACTDQADTSNTTTVTENTTTDGAGTTETTRTQTEQKAAE